MQYLLIVIVLCLWIGTCHSLSCTTSNDCIIPQLICTNGTAAACHQFPLPIGGICSCESNHVCHRAETCVKEHHASVCSVVLGRNMKWHCLDGVCKCMFADLFNPDIGEGK